MMMVVPPLLLYLLSARAILRRSRRRRTHTCEHKPKHTGAFTCFMARHYRQTSMFSCTGHFWYILLPYHLSFFRLEERKHPIYIFKILFYCTVSVFICRFQFQSISLKIFSLTHTSLHSCIPLLKVCHSHCVIAHFTTKNMFFSLKSSHRCLRWACRAHAPCRWRTELRLLYCRSSDPRPAAHHATGGT